MGALADDVEAEAWQRKVLRDFFEGERLKEIPASRKKRDVVLRWLVRRFTTGVQCREVEVNAMLKPYHPTLPPCAASWWAPACFSVSRASTGARHWTSLPWPRRMSPSSHRFHLLPPRHAVDPQSRAPGPDGHVRP
jgi:hypothetical protein